MLNGPAFIFDFDGVLVDTLELHYQTMRDACHDYGLSFERDEFFALVGRSGVDQISHFAKMEQKVINAHDVYAHKNAAYHERLNEIECIPSNCALLTSLRAAQIPVAIASSSTRRVMMPLIERFGLTCEVIVSIDDVSIGKPDPSLFLEAALRLGVSEASCVVIEDSQAGVEAVHNAGMSVMQFLAAKRTDVRSK